MFLKLFENLGLNSQCNSVFYVYKHTCSNCKAEDHYSMIDFNGVSFCDNCDEIIHHAEIRDAYDSGITELVVQIEIGKVRSDDQKEDYRNAVERRKFELLKKKYEDV